MSMYKLPKRYLNSFGSILLLLRPLPLVRIVLLVSYVYAVSNVELNFITVVFVVVVVVVEEEIM